MGGRKKGGGDELGKGGGFDGGLSHFLPYDPSRWAREGEGKGLLTIGGSSTKLEYSENLSSSI